MNDLYHMIDVWVCGIAAYVQQIEMSFMIIHGLRNLGITIGALKSMAKK